MKYAIHCYDNQFEGDNGIYSDFVMETDHYQEAIDEAKNESLELIQSYGPLLEQFWDEATERFMGDEYLPTYDDNVYGYYAELIEDDIAYKVVPIRNEAPMVIQEDFSDFVKKWRL
jgi:hypothetical protein